MGRGGERRGGEGGEKSSEVTKRNSKPRTHASASHIVLFLKMKFDQKSKSTGEETLHSPHEEFLFCLSQGLNEHVPYCPWTSLLQMATQAGTKSEMAI